MAGMLLYFLRDRLKLRSWWLPATLLAFVLLAVFGLVEWVGQLAFAYVILWLGAVLPIRLGSKNDLSYGLYIWAFPVQQLLALAGTAWLGPWGSAAVATVLALAMAWLSWVCIERPSMRLKGLFDRAKKADTKAPEPALTAVD